MDLRTILLIAGISMALGSHAARITLADRGEPKATLVLQADAPQRLRQAAEDLREYIRKRGGVALPLKRDGRRVAGTGLYIGRCEASLPADLPAPELNPESYAIRVRDGNVFFAGRHPTPAAFAVYSFIEDALGVRWFAPGTDWEYVPPVSPGRLTVTVRERVKVPDTSPRIWSGHDWGPSWRRWNLRNKTVSGEVIPRRQFQNFLNRVFPPAKYAKTHPEYYPLINGKRRIPKPGDSHWRPCESNPAVLRLTVEFARKWFDEHPDIDSFSLGMDDVSHMCGCKNCRALDPHPDSYEKHEFSDRHYKFVNAVAREIAKTHPDRYIGTLIYAIARKPPETVPKLEDNVFGFITETCALWWQPGRKAADHALSREWARRCKHLSRYDYYGMGTFAPRFYPHAMAEQIRFDKSLGFEGMYTEVYTFLPHTAPMIWALAKMQWDASLDIDSILNEFYTKMFGPAAPSMAAYFALLERSWNTPRPGRDGWVHRSMVRQALSISPEACDQGDALLAGALGQTDDPLIQKRIGVIRAALRYAAYPIRALALSRKVAGHVPVTEDEARAMLDTAKEITQLSTERAQFWAAAMKRPDLLGENLRGLARKKYLTIGKTAEVESGAVNGALEAIAWYADHAPRKFPDARNALKSALTTSAGPGIANSVKAYLWVTEHKPPNLVVNPGFEDRGANSAKAENDWTTRGAPRGWSVWNRAGDSSFKVVGGQGRRGTAGAVIDAGAGGVYLQSLDVHPGEQYLCTVWARYHSPENKPIGSFAVRFRTAEGSWHPRTDLEPKVGLEPGKGWQPLILYVRVPDKAAHMILMPGVNYPGQGAAVYFDDIAAHRLPPGP